MHKRAAAIAIAVVGAAIPLTISASAATATTTAPPVNCVSTRIQGPAYPGADAFCQNGTGHFQVVVSCLHSQSSDFAQEYRGAVVEIGSGKHSRAFCTAAFPIYSKSRSVFIPA
jgi:hypothetical protein